MVTRGDVIKQLVQYKSNSNLTQTKEAVRESITLWLNQVELVALSRQMIVDDLDSYEEYRGIGA